MRGKINAPQPRWRRRDFIKSSALASLGLSLGRLPVMGAPRPPAESDPLVPADKNLSPEWVKSLFERGAPEVLQGDKLRFVGMPVGGIGAGQLYLGGDGRLWHWDIFNQFIGTGGAHYAKPVMPDSPLAQGFALRLGDRVVPLNRDGFSEVSFRGEYPIGMVEYADPGVALAVKLEAFSPFIPLNTEDSSLPATILQFTLHNRSGAPVETTLTGSLENAICLHNRKAAGVLRNRVLQASGLTMLCLSAETIQAPQLADGTARQESSRDATGGRDSGGAGVGVFADRPGPAGALKAFPDYGTMALALLGGPADEASPDATAPFAEKLSGALGRKLTLAPGELARVTFVIAWHFPNLSLGGWNPAKDTRGGPYEHAGRHYATRFSSAQAVVQQIAANLDRLVGQTRLWRDTWYDSTLPYWFLDRTFLNISILATSTSHRFANGRFYGWEGVGSCPGTCTSVWFYEQAMARLFPDLERSVQEMQDFAAGIGFDPKTGGIWTRGEYRGDFVIDGQAGNILRAYREHQMSRDDAFLRRNWVQVKKATEWLIQQDGNHDGIIEGWQSTTLDGGHWWGAMSWTSSLYLAALRACEAMAGDMGDTEFARFAKAITDVGPGNLVARLWNGEYFIHQPCPSHPNSFIIGNGCHIDQVYGQGWAHQVGLGRILPLAQTQSALRSIWKYNFTMDVGPFRAKFKEGRWFAMPGEGGTIMTTWPNGEREYPKIVENKVAVGYLNECMNGFEHQVAGHMLWEGLVLEGLAVERAVHDRYHASRRNPWNEVECGDHYARSMASYGVFLAACGFEYHGPKQHLGFAPRLTPEHFKCAFTSAEGWGSFSQKAENGKLAAEVSVRWGRLKLQTMALENAAARSAEVRLAGQMVAADLKREGQRVLLTFKTPVEISAGETLRLVLT